MIEVLAFAALIIAPVAPVDGPLVVRKCLNRHVTQHGTPGDDKLLGTPGSDVIKAGRGDDLVIGGGGQDFLCGNRGDDTLIGGEGIDTVNGNRGTDTCIAERPRNCESEGLP